MYRIFHICLYLNHFNNILILQETAIILPENAQYPGLAKKIQKYVNKVPDFNLPDIDDYRDLIERYFDKNKPKPDGQIITGLAQGFVRTVTEKWRKRRLKDFTEDFFDIQDEEEVDENEELRKKLKENDANKTTIESVLEVCLRFAVF